MRAKTINEIQHFEKGLSKGSLQIGGINFQNEFQKKFNNLLEEYSKMLKNLEGKTITCEVIIGHEPEKKTFKVSRVFEIGIKVDSGEDYIRLSQYVEGERGVEMEDGKILKHPVYQLNLASKIYIEQ